MSGIENCSNLPKINATHALFLPNNRAIVKSILNRTNKDIWSDIIKSDIIDNFFNEIKNFDKETIFAILCSLYVRLVQYGYPFYIDIWLAKFDISDIKIKIKLTDIYIDKINQLVDEILETKINFQEYLDNKNMNIKEKLIDDKILSNIDKKYKVLPWRYFNSNDKTDFIEGIPDEKALDINQSIFGSNEYAYAAINCIKNKLQVNLYNILNYIKNNPDANYNILRFSLKVYNEYIKTINKQNEYDFYSIILINNNVNLEKLIDNRKIHYIIAKDDIDLYIPKTKQKLYADSLENMTVISEFKHLEEIRKKIGCFITSYKGYPIPGRLLQVSYEKFGYYILSAIPIEIPAMMYDAPKRNIFISFPKINLVKRPKLNAWLDIAV